MLYFKIPLILVIFPLAFSTLKQLFVLILGSAKIPMPTLPGINLFLLHLINISFKLTVLRKDSPIWVVSWVL